MRGNHTMESCPLTKPVLYNLACSCRPKMLNDWKSIFYVELLIQQILTSAKIFQYSNLQQKTGSLTTQKITIQSALTQSSNVLCTLHGPASLWTEKTSWLYVKCAGPTQPVAFRDVLNTVACLHTYYIIIFIHYSCSQTATTTSMMNQQAVTHDSTDMIYAKQVYNQI